jgi:hypothetical protein
MGTGTTKEITKGRQKERKDKQAKRTIDLGIVVDYAIQRATKKWLRQCLLQLGLQQLYGPWVTNSTRTFIAACK